MAHHKKQLSFWKKSIMTDFTTNSAKLATNEQLAQSILDNTDGRPVSDSFLRIAAIELAKRILPDVSQKPIIPRAEYTKSFEADKNNKTNRAVEQNWRKICEEKQ